MSNGGKGVKSGKGKPSGGSAKNTVSTTPTIKITPNKAELTVVLDKTGAEVATHPLLEFTVEGPANWYFEVQVSRRDGSKLSGGPGLTGAWDKSKPPKDRLPQLTFSTWTNGEKTLKLAGTGKAKYKMPLDWWKDLARQKRADFTTEEVYYRAVGFKAASGAAPIFSTPNGGSPPKVKINNNLTAFRVVDLGYVDGGITKSIRMEFTVREADTTNMYTFVQWMQGAFSRWQGPGSSPSHPSHLLYDITHEANFPDFTIDRLHTNPRYHDDAYSLSADRKTASSTDGPNQGHVAAPYTHFFSSIDFETRVHLNFEVPAAVTITRKEGSAPVYGIVSGNISPPEPFTLDSQTWKTRVLEERKSDGSIDVTHPESFAGPPAAAPSGRGCFIATAAYGSALASEVQFLRDLRDNVLRQTEWGSKFFDEYWSYYYRISPPIAEEMRRDPELMKIVRWSIVEPWTNYMRLMATRPDWEQIDWDRLDGTTADFLKQLRRDMERWLGQIELRREYTGVNAHVAVKELNVILSFIRRTGGLEYLQDLRSRGELPLSYEPSDEAALLEALCQAGRCQEEIECILYGDGRE